jgi:hypothetical protein
MTILVLLAIVGMVIVAGVLAVLLVVLPFLLLAKWLEDREL